MFGSKSDFGFFFDRLQIRWCPMVNCGTWRPKKRGNIGASGANAGFTTQLEKKYLYH
jgi:hypothetical protein